MASLVAQRHLRETTRRLEINFRRLATGKRINSAADDPAGYAISKRLEAEIKSLEKARRNADDGISLAQIAEGALGSIGDVLTRARELAVQSANGTLQGPDKDALQSELAQLLTEIDQIARSTAFSARSLLDGSRGSVTLQIGTGVVPGVDTYDVFLADVRVSALGLGSIDLGAGGDPAAAITAIDNAITTVSSKRARFGAAQNTLTGTIAAMETRLENLAAAHSRIVDVDLAAETAELAKNQLLQQVGLAILAQANAQPKIALKLLENL
jgi:flagellin